MKETMANIQNCKVNKVHINIDDYKENSYYKQYPWLFEKLKEQIDGHITCSITKTLNMECNKQLKELIISITPNVPLDKSLNERVYWILHDLHDFSTCANPNCINSHPKLDSQQYFKGFTKGYQDHCCNKCAQLDSKTTQLKKTTTLERHGDPNYRNPQKTKETYIKNYGVDHPMKSDEFKVQLMQHNLEQYGCDWYVQTSEFKDKAVQSLQDHYKEDITNPFQATKVKQQMKSKWIQHFGVDNPSKAQIIKDKQQKTFKQTSLNKYGVEWPIQNPQVFAKARRKYVYDNVQFDSFPEIAYYIWLEDNNIKFEYQPTISFKYSINGKDHYYHPDFLLIETHTIVEIKSSHVFENGKMINIYNRSLDAYSEIKHQCMIENGVHIIFEDEYMKYVEYVEEKFGKDFRYKCKKA